MVLLATSRLKFVSVERFEDEGHAIQNALMYRS